MGEDIEAEFKKASEIQAVETRKGIRERIGMMWGRLGEIKVRCPSCGHVQAVMTDKGTTCRRCGHSYKIFPATQKSRVVWCPEGKLWILRNIRSLRKHGRYDEVL